MPRVPVRRRQTHLKRRRALPEANIKKAETSEFETVEDNPTPENEQIENSAGVRTAPTSEDSLSSSSLSNSVPTVLSDHCYATSSSSSPEPEIAADTVEVYSESDIQTLLLEARENLLLFLPQCWIPVIDASGIFLLMLSRQGPKAVQRSVYINTEGFVQIRVHCKEIDGSQFLRNTMPSRPLQRETVGYFVDRAVQIVNNVRLKEVCSGCDFPEYQRVWSKCDQGNIDTNPYQECRYTETYRSSKCSILIDSSRWRCPECSGLKYFLKRKLKAELAADEHHPNTANEKLTEAQKLYKLEQQRKEINYSRKTIQSLRSRKLLEEEGVQIEKSLSNDLTDILQLSDLSAQQTLFLNEQIKASQVKNMRGMRWHPTMIRVALSIYLNSPAAYETIRDSGVIKLPSKRTLFDYTHYKPQEEGIDKVSLQSVAERVDKFPKSHQKYHVLMADEMHISKNLVFQKSTGKLVGYTSLDTLDQEVKSLETFLDDADKIVEPEEASKVLVYMVKGTSNKRIKEVVAVFGVHNMSVDQMYKWTWEVIGALERCGIAVIAFVCDGCPVNRAFIKMHVPFTKRISGVIFDTINKAAPDRLLYFISDVPHLLKTIRNCFANSRLGKKGKRLLKKNGEKIVWNTIMKLYNVKKHKVLRRAYKLNPQNVFLNSYSCMRVAYAAQVLSNTVADDLKEEKWPGISETIKFIKTFNDWFDCLNGAHSLQGRKKRNPLLNSYKSINDPRFGILESVLQYLEEWKQEVYCKGNVTAGSAMNETEEVDDPMGIGDETFNPVEDNDGDEDNTPASKRLLSSQTLIGIEMSTLAFIGVTKFLLQEKADFINARVFCQDPLEQYFSKQRAGGGGSNNPNIGQFLSRQRSIHIQGQTGIRRRRGNTESTENEFVVTEEPLPKRKYLRKT